MNYVDDFLSEGIEAASMKTDSIEAYRNFFYRAISALPQEKEPREFTKDDFINMYLVLNVKLLKTFRSTKGNMSRYIKWMVAHGNMTDSQLKEFQTIDYCDVELSDIYLRSYFSDITDLKDSLEKVFMYHFGSSNQDTSEFDTLKCVVYLSWFGFTIKEMINIKKKELFEKQLTENKKILIISTQGKTIVIEDEFCVKILTKYSNKDGYFSRKFGHEKGSFINYKNGDYFLRSCRSEKLTERAVNAMVDKINVYEDKIGRHFNVNSIYLSGIYYRIVDEERKSKKILIKDDYERIAKLFEYSLNSVEDITYNEKKTLKAKYEEFQKYKNTFYKKL